MLLLLSSAGHSACHFFYSLVASSRRSRAMGAMLWMEPPNHVPVGLEERSVWDHILGTYWWDIWMSPLYSTNHNTLLKTNIDPENGTLKDCFPLQNQWFSGSMLVFSGVF